MMFSTNLWTKNVFPCYNFFFPANYIKFTKVRCEEETKVKIIIFRTKIVLQVGIPPVSDSN